MSTRPTIVTYGRSSKKMLARKASRTDNSLDDGRALATPAKRPRSDDIASGESLRQNFVNNNESPKQEEATVLSTVRRQGNHGASPTNPNPIAPKLVSETTTRSRRSTRTATTTISHITSTGNASNRPYAQETSAIVSGEDSATGDFSQLSPTSQSTARSSRMVSSQPTVQQDSNNIFFSPGISVMSNRKRAGSPLDAGASPKRKRTFETALGSELTSGNTSSTQRSATPVEEDLEEDLVAATPKPALKPDALSQLFGPFRTAPATPPKNGMGLARRMLGRSKTESCLDSSPSSSTATKSGGVPTVPRAHASLPSLRMEDSPSRSRPTMPLSPTSVISPSRKEQLPPSVSARSTVRTYANSRSFLVPLPPGTLPSHFKVADLPIERDEDSQIRDDIDKELRSESTSYAALKERFDTDDADGIGLVTDLRSGSEMKVHGATRRFLDEVGYLLEGLESPLRGVQRTSAIELCDKMCGDDGEFVRKARTADFLNKAWEIFTDMDGAAKDPILLLCVGLFCAIVSSEARDSVHFTETVLFSETITNLCATKHDRDVLRMGKGRIPQDFAKRIGLKRNEVPLIESITSIIYQRSSLFDKSFPITSGRIASTILATFPQQSFRMAWFDDLLKSSQMELNNVVAYLSAHLDDDFIAFQGNMNILPDVEHLRECMRVVDTCLLGDNAAHCEALLIPSRRLFVSQLVHLCTMYQLLLADGVSDAVDDGVDITMRVLVNLTNRSAPWTEAMLHEPTSMLLLTRLILTSYRGWASRPDAGVQQIINSLDKLCLVLGLLTNLVQESPRTAEECLKTEIAWSCIGDRRCLRECTCSKRRTMIHVLLGIYNEQSVKAEDNGEARFLLGHLAVLLALVANQSSEALTVIRSETALDTLADTCSDWVATYEYGRRQLTVTHHMDTPLGLTAVKRAVVQLSALK